MNKLSVPPQIYNYRDYRNFLQDSFDFSQNKNSQWSYEAWARRLGLKNNSSLIKILKGQRDAGPDIQKRFSEYFKFNPEEEEFFKDLVKLRKLKIAYEEITNHSRQRNNYLGQLEKPDCESWSEEIKKIINDLKVRRSITYKEDKNFYFRILVQFSTKNSEEIINDYFQEQVIIKRNHRVFSSVSHFVHKGGGHYKIFAEKEITPQVQVQRFNPGLDDNIRVNFDHENLPSFKTITYRIDQSDKFGLHEFEYQKDVFIMRGEIINKRLKRFDD